MQIPFARAMLIAAALSSPLGAQIGGGSIVGTVTDPSNAAIVGAHVTATNLGTNETRKAVTNELGYYEFPLLNAGRYRLEAVADATITFSESAMQDVHNLAGSYDPKQGDIRHRFVSVYSVNIPAGRFASSGVSKAMFGGWTFQGIVTTRSGLPLISP